MSNVTEEGKRWFALIPADELRSADLRVFGGGLWFVICDCFCYEDQKKKKVSFTFAINVIYFRIHAKVNDDADLLIILEMFRSHSLWWLYRDIIIFLTRRKTKIMISSRCHLSCTTIYILKAVLLPVNEKQHFVGGIEGVMMRQMHPLNIDHRPAWNTCSYFLHVQPVKRALIPLTLFVN